MPWQPGFPNGHNGRKQVCRGSLASTSGSLASPRRREENEGWQGATKGQPGFPKGLPQGAGKQMKGGRVLSVRFGTVEKRYAFAAWLPKRAAWFPQGYAGLCWICWIGKNRQEKQRSTPTVLLEQWIEKQEDYVEK